MFKSKSRQLNNENQKGVKQMKTKFGSIFLLGCYLLFSNAYAGMTYGGTDCGKWNQQKSESDKGWLLGYMSGLSMQNTITTNGKSDPLGKITSAYQIWSWMDNYCQKNPLDTLVQGGHQLFEELKKK